MEDDKQNNNKKKRAHTGWPSMEQFHEILQEASSDETTTIQFTEAAVAGLRAAFLAYIDIVGASLAEHDSLKDESLVEQALSINPQFAEFTQQAKEIIRQSDAKPSSTTTGKRKKKKKLEITAEMEAEQERLLQQSREAVMNKKQKAEE